MIPGELFIGDDEVELNVGRETISVSVANIGDRPIQIGSHYHFFEVNAALQFDRAATPGFRLNIAAGTAVRFEPGQIRLVELVALAGDRHVYGFAGAVMGPLAATEAGRVCAASSRSPALSVQPESAGEPLRGTRGLPHAGAPTR